MKKSELRKIIRESIKGLMVGQNTSHKKQALTEQSGPYQFPLATCLANPDARIVDYFGNCMGPGYNLGSSCVCMIIDGGNVIPTNGLLVKGPQQVYYAGSFHRTVVQIDNIRTIVNGASSDGCSLTSAGFDVDLIAPAGTACGFNCSGPGNPPNSSSNMCSFDATSGNPTYPFLTDCIDSLCITPSWDCVANVCTDPGTGNGAHSTLTACQAVCAPITGACVSGDFPPFNFANACSNTVYDSWPSYYTAPMPSPQIQPSSTFTWFGNTIFDPLTGTNINSGDSVMSNSIRLLLLNSNLKCYGYVLTLSKGLITLKVIVNAIISQNQNILFLDGLVRTKK
jgi:hypothetical protein